MFRIESISVGSIPTESYVGQMFIFKCSILNIFRKQIEFAPNLPPPPPPPSLWTSDMRLRDSVQRRTETQDMGDRDKRERDCVHITRSVRQAGKGTPSQLQGKKAFNELE
jgi:hypothetical protein